MNNEFQEYKRLNEAQMRPYVEGETLDAAVSVSDADKEAGSPKVGDMIARNPDNHEDQWLVAQDYYEKNFEPYEKPFRRKLNLSNKPISKDSTIDWWSEIEAHLPQEEKTRFSIRDCFTHPEKTAVKKLLTAGMYGEFYEMCAHLALKGFTPPNGKYVEMQRGKKEEFNIALIKEKHLALIPDEVLSEMANDILESFSLSEDDEKN